MSLLYNGLEGKQNNWQLYRISTRATKTWFYFHPVVIDVRNAVQIKHSGLPEMTFSNHLKAVCVTINFSLILEIFSIEFVQITHSYMHLEERIGNAETKIMDPELNLIIVYFSNNLPIEDAIDLTTISNYHRLWQSSLPCSIHLHRQTDSINIFCNNNKKKHQQPNHTKSINKSTE